MARYSLMKQIWDEMDIREWASTVSTYDAFVVGATEWNIRQLCGKLRTRIACDLADEGIFMTASGTESFAKAARQ